MITKGETGYHITSAREDWNEFVAGVCILISGVAAIGFLVLGLADLGFFNPAMR